MNETKLKVEYVPVERLKPHPENPRLIKDEQFRKLCESVKANPDYFETRPVLYNPQGIVFAGNMRLRAAIEVGMKAVPAVLMDIPEERQREIMIRDNVQNGEWDTALLASEFDQAALEGWGVDMEDFGVFAPPAENAEVKPEELGATSTLSFTFPHEKYLTVLGAIGKIKSEYGLESNEDALEKLLEQYLP